MSKYLDIKVGKKLKVYRYREGQSNYGKWALFSYTPYEKNDKGDVKYGQEYSILIANIEDVSKRLSDGDLVEIASINSVSANDTSYKDKTTGMTINKRVISVSVNIVVDNNSQYNNNNSNEQVPSNQYPPVFDGITIDSNDLHP